MKKSKMLVTGGAGFMGSHLASELIERGHLVTVLDDLSGGFPENVPSIADAPFNPAAQNQVFNIGADTPYTVNELANQVAKVMGVAPNIKYLEPRNEVKHAFSSHRRMEEVFGYRAKFSLTTGLARMARWARAVGAKRSKLFENVEVVKNMPRNWQEELSLAPTRVRV